jgi:hypothetical protein
MAFPHPQSRKDKYRNEDKPSGWGVVWNLVKRTINVTDYRNAQDDVNPASNRTFGGITHMQVLLWLLVFHTELLAVLRVQPLPAELHRVATSDATDGSSAEKAIQNIETNVPARGTPRDEASIDVVPSGACRH